MARGAEPIASRALAGVGWVFFVFCLILSIYFYLEWQEASAQRAAAREDLTEFVKDAERQDERIQQIRTNIRESGTGQSVVGALLTEVANLKSLVGGATDTSIRATVSELSSMGIPEGTPLMYELRNLTAERDANLNQIASLNEQIQGLGEKLAVAEQEKTALAQQFDTSVTSLRSELSNVQSEYGSEQQRLQGQITGFEGEMQQIRESKQSEIDQLRTEIEQREQQIALLNKRIRDLQAVVKQRGSGTDVDVRTLPDGQVAAILTEENLVYIDRGKVDHIVPGMTFQVYDSDEVIKLLQPMDELEGKATIEVVNVGETASVARVVATNRRNAVINEGDQIANLVYDPQATFKFYVHGDFDIDNAGRTSVSDRRRIETMILQWGGKLAQASDEEGRELSYDVDYLVLGEEPELPSPLPSGTFDPELIEAHRAKQRRWERYNDLVSEARELQIPVLNQNRFLTLVGYYQR